MKGDSNIWIYMDGSVQATQMTTQVTPSLCTSVLVCDLGFSFSYSYC